jgi:hypothetical protein
VHNTNIQSSILTQLQSIPFPSLHLLSHAQLPNYVSLRFAVPPKAGDSKRIRIECDELWAVFLIGADNAVCQVEPVSVLGKEVLAIMNCIYDVQNKLTGLNESVNMLHGRAGWIVLQPAQ